MNLVPEPLIAAAIGNTSVRLGLFEAAGLEQVQLPQPAKTFVTSSDSFEVHELPPWCRSPNATWLIASVRRDVEHRLTTWIRESLVTRLCKSLRYADFPIRADVSQPDHVGADRLAAAVAVNGLRSPGRAAVFIDSGTALTVNLVNESGTFLGGGDPSWYATSGLGIGT